MSVDGIGIGRNGEVRVVVGKNGEDAVGNSSVINEDRDIDGIGGGWCFQKDSVMVGVS